MLEKSFIILKLQGFSRDLANEITKKNKYYFYDLGVRNAVINQFNGLDQRDDISALWENFIIIERIKRNHYLRTFHNSYFWRTYQQHEVDYVEEKDVQINAYEIKWNEQTKNKKGLINFKSIYQKASIEFVHRENYLSFVGSP